MFLSTAMPGRLEPRYSKKCEDWTYSNASAHYPTTAAPGGEDSDALPLTSRPAATFKRRVGALFFSPRRRAFLAANNKVGGVIKLMPAVANKKLDNTAVTPRQLGDGDERRAQFDHYQDFFSRVVEEAERRHQALIRDQLLFHLGYVEQLAGQLESVTLRRECAARLRAASETIRLQHQNFENTAVNGIIERKRRFSVMGLRKIYSHGDLKSRTSAMASLTRSVPLTAERVVAAAGAGGGDGSGSGTTPAGTTCSDGAWKTRAIVAAAIGGRRQPLPLKSASDANIKARSAAGVETRPTRRRPSQNASIARLAEALNSPVAVGALAHPILKSDDSQYATALVGSGDDASLIGYENAINLNSPAESAWCQVATTGVSLRMLQAFRDAAANTALPMQTGRSDSPASLVAGNYAVPAECFGNSVEISSALSSPSLTCKRRTSVQLTNGGGSHGSVPTSAMLDNCQSFGSDENEASGSKSLVAPNHFMNAVTAPADGAPPPPGLVKPVTPPPLTALASSEAAARHRNFRRTLCETLRKNVSGSFTKYDGDRATHEYPHVLSSDEDEDKPQTRSVSALERPTRLLDEEGSRQRQSSASERAPLVQHSLHHHHLEPTLPASDERHRQHFHNDDCSPRRNQLRQRHYQQQRGTNLVSPIVSGTKKPIAVTVPAAAIPTSVSPLPPSTEKNIYDNDNYGTDTRRLDSPDVSQRRDSPIGGAARKRDDSYDYVDDVGCDQTNLTKLPVAKAPSSLSESRFPSSISMLAAGIAAAGIAPIVSDQRARADSTSAARIATLLQTSDVTYGNVIMSPVTTISSRSALESTSEQPFVGHRPSIIAMPSHFLNSSASLPLASIDENHNAAYCNYRPGGGGIDEEDDFDFYEELSDGNSDEYDGMMSLSSSLVSVRSELNPRIIFQRGGRGRASGHSIKSQRRKQQQQQRRQLQQQQKQEQKRQQQYQQSTPERIDSIQEQKSAQQRKSMEFPINNRNANLRADIDTVTKGNDHNSDVVPRIYSVGKLPTEDVVSSHKLTHSITNLNADSKHVPHGQSMYRTAVNLTMSGDMDINKSNKNNKEHTKINAGSISDKIDSGIVCKLEDKVDEKLSGKPVDKMSDKADITNEIEHPIHAKIDNKMNDKPVDKMDEKSVEEENHKQLSCNSNVAPPLPPKPAQMSQHRDRLRRVASSDKFRDVNSIVSAVSQPRKYSVAGGPSLFVDIYDDYADIVINTPQNPQQMPTVKAKKISEPAITVVLPPLPIFDDEQIDYVSICPTSTMALGKLSRNRKRFSALVKKSNSISGLDQKSNSRRRRQNSTSAALASADDHGDHYFHVDSASLSSRDASPPPPGTAPIWCAAPSPFFDDDRAARAAAFAHGRQNSTPQWMGRSKAAAALPATVASAFKRTVQPLSSKKKASSSLFLFKH